MHEKKQTQCTLAPLGFQSTCCLQKWAMVCMSSTLQNKNKTKDQIPSMTLSELPKQNDQVPFKEKLPKDTQHYCNYGQIGRASCRERV